MLWLLLLLYFIFLGDNPAIVTWCQSYNNSLNSMKTKRSIGFDPSADFHRFKITIRPEKDDSVDVSRP